MDTDFWRISIPTAIATIGFFILFFAFVIAIRNKSIGCGLGAIGLLLLFLSPFIGFVGLLYLYRWYVPEGVQLLIGKFALGVAFIALQLFNLNYNTYRVKAGYTVLGRARNLHLSKNTLSFLVLSCLLTMASDLFYVTDVYESIRQIKVWWILALPIAIHVFFSFEFREKGFVYRGKVVLFSDIEHAEWENSRDKAKLKVKLINKEQEILIKTPWEMNIQIDNYLRDNFPRP